LHFGKLNFLFFGFEAAGQGADLIFLDDDITPASCKLVFYYPQAVFHALQSCQPAQYWAHSTSNVVSFQTL
jgi:hypothetical protein